MDCDKQKKIQSLKALRQSIANLAAVTTLICEDIPSVVESNEELCSVQINFVENAFEELIREIEDLENTITKN